MTETTTPTTGSGAMPVKNRDGIVVNLPSMRLYLFTNEGDAEDPRVSITTHAIGIGREGWATPLGSSTVTEKIVDPAWYPPVSVREEHAANGDPLPAVVPPGPDNPLGRHAMLLSIPGSLLGVVFMALLVAPAVQQLWRLLWLLQRCCRWS